MIQIAIVVANASFYLFVFPYICNAFHYMPQKYMLNINYSTKKTRSKNDRVSKK